MNQIDTSTVLAQMQAMAEQARGTAPAEQPPPAGAEFTALLQRSIDRVNELQQQSRSAKEAFRTGASDMSLAEVVLASEKAGIAFQAVLQVRNKVIQAYQDVINMPL